MDGWSRAGFEVGEEVERVDDEEEVCDEGRGRYL